MIFDENGELVGVTPDEIPDELIHAADLALADKCLGADECVCPTDEQIRIIISASLTRSAPLLISGALDGVAEWFRTEGKDAKTAALIQLMSTGLLSLDEQGNP